MILTTMDGDDLPHPANANIVKRQVYQVEDLVIKRIILPQSDPSDKWTPTYEGPFVIKNIFSGGAMILTTMDGDDLPHPANTDIVKRYYA